MGVRYRFQPNDNGGAIGNLDPDCIGCAQACSIGSEIVKCRVTGKRRRRGLTEMPLGKLYLCTDEAIKSSRLFREKIRAFSEIIPSVTQARKEATRQASDDVHRFIHNLITLNARTIQAIHRVVPQEDFNQENREDLIKAVSNKLSLSIDQTVLLVINILKNANLEKTEFAVYAKFLEKEPASLNSHPIHKIVMLVLNTYWWEVLKEKDVSVRVGDCRENVLVDYEIIVASLVHLLDNTTKYILPESQLKISFETTSDAVNLVLDMISLRIHADEIDSIFCEGFSGKEPQKIGLQGEGRGLYIVDRLLALTNSAIKVERDVNKERRVSRMSFDFENNIFRLSMPRV